MTGSKLLVLALGVFGIVLAGCSTQPASDSGREELHDDVASAQHRIYLEDPYLENFLKQADGYVIFPSVGKGGFIAGGAYGRGQVYEQSQFIGYADISQATLGAQLGGQTFTEVVAFQNTQAMENFKSGQFAFDANASAVALKSGAAASAKYDHGVAVFVEPIGGLMVEASVGGQSFSFQPK